MTENRKPPRGGGNVIYDCPGDAVPPPRSGLSFLHSFPEFRWRFTPGFIPSHLWCFLTTAVACPTNDIRYASTRQAPELY